MFVLVFLMAWSFSAQAQVAGSISGMKWEDVDGNGALNSGVEGGMSGWTIYLDLNNNGQLDATDISTTTAADGSFSFTGLVFRDYIVREVNRAGWKQTSPSSGKFEFNLNANITSQVGISFGNQKLPEDNGCGSGSGSGSGSSSDSGSGSGSGSIGSGSGSGSGSCGSGSGSGSVNPTPTPSPTPGPSPSPTPSPEQGGSSGGPGGSSGGTSPSPTPPGQVLEEQVDVGGGEGLPRTGFPIDLLFTLSLLGLGYGLKK